MSSVVVKSVDAAAVRRAVDQYAKWLLETRPDVEEIVVFGSFAKGTYSPGSDIDLLVVLKDSNKSGRDRIPDLLPGAFPVGLDLLPCTRAEMETRRDSALMREALSSNWRYGRT